MSISKFSNRVALSLGNYNGLDVVLGSTAAGAGFGLIGGAFSSDETMLSGAIKGSMLGLPLGTGLKYAGSRYSKGFIAQHGVDAAKVGRSKDSTYGWNTDYLSNGAFGPKESFMSRFG